MNYLQTFIIHLAMSKRISFNILLIFIWIGSCMPGSETENLSPVFEDYIVLMAIDESSIDNGIGPNGFSESDVNHAKTD